MRGQSKFKETRIPPLLFIMSAADQIAIWNDETANVTGVKLKTAIPEIKPVDLKLEYIRGGHETLVRLGLAIAKTCDKEIVMRCLASAVGIIFKQDRDLLGGSGKAITLPGLDDENAPLDQGDPSRSVGHHDGLGPDVTAAEVNEYMGDIDEIGAYFGVLFLAGTKKRTPKNRPAFNANRVSNVKSTVNGELTIFTENSIFLSDEVLDAAYTAFNSFYANRAHLVSETVRLVAGTYVGAALSFQNMFVLLEDSGLGSLRIIKEAILKYQFIRRKFPEIQTELNAANEAQKCIRRLPAGDRPFCKAIYGNRFVPMSQNEVANLLGICKKVMSYTVATYRQFDGGNVSERQDEQIEEEMAALGIEVTPETSD
jgi:hypothetical protein